MRERRKRGGGTVGKEREGEPMWRHSFEESHLTLRASEQAVLYPIVPRSGSIFRAHEATPSHSRVGLVQSYIPLCAMNRRACAVDQLSHPLYPPPFFEFASLSFPETNGSLVFALSLQGSGFPLSLSFCVVDLILVQCDSMVGTMQYAVWSIQW